MLSQIKPTSSRVSHLLVYAGYFSSGLGKILKHWIKRLKQCVWIKGWYFEDLHFFFFRINVAALRTSFPSTPHNTCCLTAVRSSRCMKNGEKRSLWKRHNQNRTHPNTPKKETQADTRAPTKRIQRVHHKNNNKKKKKKNPKQHETVYSQVTHVTLAQS